MPDVSPRLSSLLAYVRSGEPDLTNRQVAMMLVVGEMPGPHTVRGLAATLAVAKPVITRGLNTLAGLGFVRRVPDPDDRRSLFVVLTDAGRDFTVRNSVTDFTPFVGRGTETPPRPDPSVDESPTSMRPPLLVGDNLNTVRRAVAGVLREREDEIANAALIEGRRDGNLFMICATAAVEAVLEAMFE